jgi:hypothetical protein
MVKLRGPSLSALIRLLLVIPLDILAALRGALLGIIFFLPARLLLVARLRLRALVLLVARIVRHEILLFCDRVSK